MSAVIYKIKSWNKPTIHTHTHTERVHSQITELLRGQGHNSVDRELMVWITDLVARNAIKLQFIQPI